ncbi:MAG: hypothetical protein LBQ30_10120 [Treponema sp.]|jgi:hypothetical protein|nr:hypothetical protein [Treponema sp.]
MTAAVMVRPGGEVVLPLAPEMIRNEDAGEERAKGDYEKHKQDGERKAAARLLEKHGKYYKALKATVLGDDVYANHGTGKAILDQGLSFIFTCKDESHPWIAEQVEWGVPETLKTAVWTGRNHLEYHYK